MKIGRRRPRLPLLLLLAATVALSEAAVADTPRSLKELVSESFSSGSSGGDTADAAGVSSRSGRVGTAHAPVDGKDGMPHEGPWVETEGERSRRKDKATKEDVVEVAAPPSSVDTAGLPQSNEGVMDDKHRKKPEDGTRGVEGGVSERKKQSRLEEKEKKPEQPKEVPPLPPIEKDTIQNHQEGGGGGGGGGGGNPGSNNGGSNGGGSSSSSSNGGNGGDEPEAAAATAEDADSSSGGTGGAGGAAASQDKKPLAVPDDLPAKPHDIPHPENPSSPKDETIVPETDKSNKSPASASNGKPDHEPAVISPTHSLLLSLAMILVSEIGDKTFLVACLMAMRHDRLVVFSAAYSALVAMTVLSAVLGHAVPTLIPRQYTNFIAAALFLVFGVRLLLDVRKIAPNEGVAEEMKEVEQELEEHEHAAAHRRRRSTLSRRRAPSAVTPYILESGRAKAHHKSNNPSRTFPSSPPESPSSSRSASPAAAGATTSRFSFSALSGALDGLANLFSFLLSPAWVQTFVMTFLGEWGDRSQVATIAMAAGQDYWWVTVGALVGHAVCTGMAVIGGKAIAGRVSLRTVTLGGAITFLAFAVLYLLEALY